MLTRCDEAVVFQIVKQRHLDNGTVHKVAAWNTLLTHKFAACNTLLTPPGGVILLRFLVLSLSFCIYLVIECTMYENIRYFNHEEVLVICKTE